jgi:hypothetical protein
MNMFSDVRGECLAGYFVGPHKANDFIILRLFTPNSILMYSFKKLHDLNSKEVCDEFYCLLS